MRFLKHNLLKDEGINPFQLQLFRLLNGRKIRLRREIEICDIIE